MELVRSIRAAWERGDFSSSDWADPEIEWVFADGPSPGTWTGLAGIAEGFREFASTWDQLRSEAEEYRELDDERVLVLTHLSGGRGKASGLDVAQLRTEGAAVFHVREDKVTRYVVWFNRENAFADLGLAPDADSP
jgi:ketosteroid isomerase-like protein